MSGVKSKIRRSDMYIYVTLSLLFAMQLLQLFYMTSLAASHEESFKNIGAQWVKDRSDISELQRKVNGQ